LGSCYSQDWLYRGAAAAAAHWLQRVVVSESFVSDTMYASRVWNTVYRACILICYSWWLSKWLQRVVVHESSAWDALQVLE
jgi:hypothetical protein